VGGLRWVDMLGVMFCPCRAMARSGGAMSARWPPLFALAARAARSSVLGGFVLENADAVFTHLGELWARDRVCMNEWATIPMAVFIAGRWGLTTAAVDRHICCLTRPLALTPRPHSAPDVQRRNTAMDCSAVLTTALYPNLTSFVDLHSLMCRMKVVFGQMTQ
jgi:hypothetical protein